MLGEFVVRTAERFGGREALLQVVPQHDFGDHHKERCRYAFARNVCNHEGQMVVADHEVVVKVATNFKCGAHHSVVVESFDIDWL